MSLLLRSLLHRIGIITVIRTSRNRMTTMIACRHACSSTITRTAPQSTIIAQSISIPATAVNTIMRRLRRTSMATPHHTITVTTSLHTITATMIVTAARHHRHDQRGRSTSR